MGTTGKKQKKCELVFQNVAQPLYVHGVVYKDNPAWVVWWGREPGIYMDEDQFKKQIEGWQGAQYRRYDNIYEAFAAYKEPYKENIEKPIVKPTPVF